MSVLPIPSFLDDIKEKGFRKAVYEGLDETITRITTGMNIQDIREALRGDPPSRRPNPRLTPHADGFFLHIRPSYYNEAVTGIYPTFRLGWLSTYFFILETITGIFLMIFYTPSPDRAYENMIDILGNVPMGQFMRDLHRLGAEGMVIFVALHMLRTFVTGSYKRPRQFTWATGGLLLWLTLLLSFSGYLLPWDQLAFWAVTIGTSMAEAAPPQVVGTNVNLLLRGAPDIGSGGLLRFYLLHVLLVPLVAFLTLFVHYYKVVLHGHSLPPRKEEIGQDTAKRVPVDKRVYFIPDVLTIELLWLAMTTLVLVAMVTWFFHAPLENHADPQVTPLHTTAPWYFLWLQGMLKLGDKILMGVVIPTFVVIFSIVLPYLDVSRSRRYAHRRVALTLGMITCLALVVLTYMGTPFYGVSTAADQEVAQEMIPGEKIGPVRSTPYDQLVLTTNTPLFGNLTDPSTSGIPMDQLDAAIVANGAVVVSKDNLEELAAHYEKDSPEFYHALVELHHLLYEKHADELPNALGYLVISQHQPTVRRVQLIMTWDKPHLDEASQIIVEDGETKLELENGKPIRMTSGAVAFIHQESEWHEE